MFSNDYTFGRIEIDSCVIEELQNWVDKKNAKCRKFGEQFLLDLIKICDSRTGNLKEPTPEEMARSKKHLSNIESRLSPTNGSATSKNDKRLLTMAWKNKAHLVTQDEAMRKTARSSLPPGSKLFSFKDLIDDLLNTGLLTQEDITIGIDTLNRYGESF